MSPRKRPAHPRPRGRPRSPDPADRSVRCSARAAEILRGYAERHEVPLRAAIEEAARVLAEREAGG